MKTRDRDLLDALPRLRRYAQMLTRDVHDAEDVLQEALLRAHQAQAPRPPARMAWFMAIVRNTFVDQIRSRSAARRRDAAFAQLLPDVADAPQEMRVRLEQLRRRMLSLPDDQREVLHLIAIDGLSYAEAAELLGIPSGTLMSRLSRARAALRRLEDEPRIYVVGGRDGH